MTEIDDTLHGTPEPALPGWKLGARSLLPIVQGGMGVGISAHRLAGTCRWPGCGRNDFQRRPASPPSRSARTRAGLHRQGRTRQAQPDRARPRGPHGARISAAGHGALAVNVMKAVSQYPAYVRQSCESGAARDSDGRGPAVRLAGTHAGFSRRRSGADICRTCAAPASCSRSGCARSGCLTPS